MGSFCPSTRGSASVNWRWDTVCVWKSDSSLRLFHQGATIRRDEATGAVIVARIMRGGAADRSGETNSVHTAYITMQMSVVFFNFSKKKLKKLPTQQDFLISTDIQRSEITLRNHELSTEIKSLRLVPQDCIFWDYKQGLLLAVAMEMLSTSCQRKIFFFLFISEPQKLHIHTVGFSVFYFAWLVDLFSVDLFCVCVCVSRSGARRGRASRGQWKPDNPQKAGWN